MLPYYDIDEMHTSGYDPSTIEAAETYNARWDALFASPIGQYLREGTPEEVILVSGVRLLPLAEVVERTRGLVPDKILFDEGFAPIASSMDGNCLAYDPQTRAFYRADHSCVSGTGYLLTPGDYEELPYSPTNLRKALILVSQDPPGRFIADLMAGMYEEPLDDSLLVEEKTVHHPLFGELVWDSSARAWEGRVHIAFFAGCGPPAEDDYPERETFITLYDVTGQGPSAEQENALIYLLENESAVSQAIVQGILSCYQEDVYEPLQKRKKYLASRKMVRQSPSSAEKQLEEVLPKLESPEGLKRVISLRQLYFGGSPCEGPHGGFARVGWSFYCTWDEEHGVGVRTHKDVVEGVGADDVAFCL